jgi:phosphatidylglycerophosphate synthase
MARLLDDYKKTLKPRETEEYINSVFFRPMGFLLVLLVRRFNFSPNYYTIVSLICGLASGYCFSQGLLTVGALLLVAMISFDCSDGQLARLKNAFSRSGKMLDAIADIVSYSAMLLGLAYYQYHGFPLFLLMAIGAFAVLALNTLFYDQFKNLWISFTQRSYGDKLEALTSLREQYKERRGLSKAALFIYYQVYRLESYITKLGSLSDSKGYSTIIQTSSQPSREICELYRVNFRISVRLWSLIGTSTHFSLVAVLVLLGQVRYVFPVFIIYSLVLCFLLTLYQNFRFYKFRTAVESAEETGHPQ